MNFHLIPGPKSLPVFGTLLNYVPIIGSSWSFNALHKTGLKKYKQFGPIIREEILPKNNIVWIYEPDDIQTLFTQENKQPERHSHAALVKYRTNSPKYSSAGLIPTNGPEWSRLRSAFQKGLSDPTSVQCYLPLCNQITNEWIMYLDKCGPPKNFLEFLGRFYLEQTCAALFGIRLQGFSYNEALRQRSSDILYATRDINDCVTKTDYGLRLWRWIRTPAYRQFEKAHRVLDEYAIQFLSNAINEYQPDQLPTCILHHYLQNKDLKFEDLTGVVADYLLASSDTQTYVTSYLLYNLAKNQDKQTELYKECKQIIDSIDGRITVEVLDKAKYAKATLKENHRLNPISVGVGRVLTNEMILSGYRIPKGTNVVTQNQVICRFEKYFKNANNFVPERWIKGHDEYQVTHPFLVLPFGHGSRSCIARRLAEQNLLVFLLKVINTFEVYWKGDGNLDSVTHLINKPDRPLKFYFKKRLH